MTRLHAMMSSPLNRSGLVNRRVSICPDKRIVRSELSYLLVHGVALYLMKDLDDYSKWQDWPTFPPISSFPS